MVDVHLHLGEAAEGCLVGLLGRQRDVAAVTDVHSDRQRFLLELPAEQGRLVLGECEQHPLLVTLAWRDVNGGSHSNHVEGLHGRAGRTETIRSCQPRVGRPRVWRPITGLAQTWCTGVQVRSERWSPLEMRFQHREGGSSRVGVEQDDRSVPDELVTGSGREVAWHALGEVRCLRRGRLGLAEVQRVLGIAVVDGPIPHARRPGRRWRCRAAGSAA